MPNMSPNHAHFEGLSENGKAEQDLILNKEVVTLHAQGDPGSTFDIIIEDQAGNEKLVKKGCQNPSGRWGERINLKLTDSYHKLRVENVKGTKSLDVFCE